MTRFLLNALGPAIVLWALIIGFGFAIAEVVR